MTKNENNSHAFLRKMVENIKLTKDAQCPDDAKANEVSTPCGRGSEGRAARGLRSVLTPSG